MRQGQCPHCHRRRARAQAADQAGTALRSSAATEVRAAAGKRMQLSLGELGGIRSSKRAEYSPASRQGNATKRRPPLQARRASAAGCRSRADEMVLLAGTTISSTRLASSMRYFWTAGGCRLGGQMCRAGSLTEMQRNAAKQRRNGGRMRANAQHCCGVFGRFYAKCRGMAGRAGRWNHGPMRTVLLPGTTIS